jgi:hypothetical protein
MANAAPVPMLSSKRRMDAAGKPARHANVITRCIA